MPRKTASKTLVTTHYPRKDDQCEVWLCKRKARKDVKGTGKRIHRTCDECWTRAALLNAITFHDKPGWVIAYAPGVAEAL